MVLHPESSFANLDSSRRDPAVPTLRICWDTTEIVTFRYCV